MDIPSFNIKRGVFQGDTLSPLIFLAVFNTLIQLCNSLSTCGFSLRLPVPNSSGLRPHCKNSWVTLTTFLGCLSCISVTKKCYQGFLECPLRNLFFSYISYKSLISEDLFAYIPCNHSNQGTLQEQMCKIKETTNFTIKCCFIGFLKGDTNLPKREAS